MVLRVLHKTECSIQSSIRRRVAQASSDCWRWHQLMRILSNICRGVIRQRLGGLGEPTQEDVAGYPSGQLDGDFGTDGGDIGPELGTPSVGYTKGWQEVALESDAKGISSCCSRWTLPWFQRARQVLLGRLRAAIRSTYCRRLLGKAIQGKVVEYLFRAMFKITSFALTGILNFLTGGSIERPLR